MSSYRDDKLWLMQGDCIERMQEVPDSGVDMVLVDPPYGVTRCAWDTPLDLSGAWEALARVTKENTAVLFFGSQPFTSVLVSSNLPMFRYTLVWEKTTPTGHLNAKKMPLRAHEDICVFYKKLPTYNPTKTQGHKRKVAKANRDTSKAGVYGAERGVIPYDSTERYPRSVIKTTTDKQRSVLHSTQKPVVLLSQLIQMYSNPGDTVLDFTMGSGSTGVACLETSRRFIGIELDEVTYCVAKERLLAL